MSPEEQLVIRLRKHGLVHGELSRWGKPSLRPIRSGHEPQRLMDADGLQRRFVECAHATPSPGDGLCAAWVEQAYSRLGLGAATGDAAELYARYCRRDDTAKLMVGMIVAVPRHPHDPTGLRHGHVGIYVGDGIIMDAAGRRVRKARLELWLSCYGLMDEPRWGWLCGVALG